MRKANILILMIIFSGALPFMAGCFGAKESVSLTSISPDKNHEVQIIELNRFIDRNFDLRLKDTNSKNTKTIFTSPDEGIAGTEEIIWSKDSSRFLLIGSNFLVNEGTQNINGKDLYLMYDVLSGNLFCNALQQQDYQNFAYEEINDINWTRELELFDNEKIRIMSINLPEKLKKLLFDSNADFDYENIEIKPPQVKPLAKIMIDPANKHFARSRAAYAIIQAGKESMIELLEMQYKFFEGEGPDFYAPLGHYTHDHFCITHRKIENMLFSIVKNKKRNCRTAAILLGLNFMSTIEIRLENAVMDGNEKGKEQYSKTPGMIKETLENLKNLEWPLSFWVHHAMASTSEPPAFDENIYARAVETGKKEVRRAAYRFLYRNDDKLELKKYGSLKSRLLNVVNSDSRTDEDRGFAGRILMDNWPETEDEVEKTLEIERLKSTVKRSEYRRALKALAKLRIYGISFEIENYDELLEKGLSDGDPSLRKLTLEIMKGGEINGNRGLSSLFPLKRYYPGKISKLIFKSLWDDDAQIRRLAGWLVADNPDDYNGLVPFDDTWWEDCSPGECKKTAEKYKENIMKVLTGDSG